MPAIVFNEINTDELDPPKYQVPEVLNDTGFYFLAVTQLEMYDLGNTAEIVHYILYDRKLKIAVDITSDVYPAPLLSRTQPVNTISKQNIETLEQLLSRELNADDLAPNEFHKAKVVPAVTAFRAKELDPVNCHQIRMNVARVVEARQVLDRAIQGTQLDIKALQDGGILPKEPPNIRRKKKDLASK